VSVFACACVCVCVCVCVALFIQHEIPMHHIILFSVAFLALLYFSTLPHKQHDFLKLKILKIICVYFLFSLQLFQKHSSL